MSSIENLYEDAIRYEESFLAHYIICLIQEGKIAWHDDDSVLTQVQPDSEKLLKMVETNFLGFCPINIYGLKVKNGRWAFIYAKSPQEAKNHLWKLTGETPLICRELSPDQTLFIGNRFLNFREWKKEQSEFPCLVGFYGN
ncbi:hypothetical protein K0H71_00535 [Bacillus sp. IITD106]|nr:hypothetical protein [Bacillus sp. IITD106]